MSGSQLWFFSLNELHTIGSWQVRIVCFSPFHCLHPQNKPQFGLLGVHIKIKQYKAFISRSFSFIRSAEQVGWSAICITSNIVTWWNKFLPAAIGCKEAGGHTGRWLALPGGFIQNFAILNLFLFEK